MKIGERGQVTIPRELRERFGLKPAMEIEFTVESEKLVLRKAGKSLPLQKWVGKCRGSLKRLGFRSADDYLRALTGPRPKLCGHFTKKGDYDLFLKEIEIEVVPANGEACFLANRVWLQYLKQGGNRIRILPDFLIEAHAQMQASCLVSRDAGFFRKHFLNLNIISPSAR